ncbi:MAG: YciI family protein [Flavitalea sp.]
MKNIFFTILILSCISSVNAQQKENTSSSSAGKDSKTDASKADTPKMKQYFFVMLTKGPNRGQDSATAANLQKGHMDNMGKMAKDGKLLVAGPFGDDGDWRGIFILDCATKEEAEAMVKADPAIQAGRLGYEIHPWWTMTNAVFK